MSLADPRRRRSTGNSSVLALHRCHVRDKNLPCDFSTRMLLQHPTTSSTFRFFAAWSPREHSRELEELSRDFCPSYSTMIVLVGCRSTRRSRRRANHATMSILLLSYSRMCEPEYGRSSR